VLTSIEDILKVAELPEESVPLCLRGTLVAEFERLEQELLAAPTQATSLGDIPQAAEIARRMDALRDDMRAATAEFRLRARPAREWSDFFATKPEQDASQDKVVFEDAWHAWLCQMVADTCYQPTMTAGQVDKLSKKLSGNQWTRLTDAAWAVNAQQQSIPFSAAASAVLQATGGRSRQPEQSASPDHGSLAGNPEPSSSTSTTTPDV
jgi:hypothetical protein